MVETNVVDMKTTRVECKHRDSGETVWIEQTGDGYTVTPGGGEFVFDSLEVATRYAGKFLEVRGQYTLDLKVRADKYDDEVAEMKSFFARYKVDK